MLAILPGLALPYDGMNRADQACNGGYYAHAISGIKYLDVNGNGAQDYGEQGLSGVTIKLLDSKNRPLSQVKTDPRGYYEFDHLATGTYTVTEVVPAGYVNTTPASKVVIIGPRTKEVKVNFGNVRPATIEGLKYYDLNKNSKCDKGEPGLGGWTIQLKAPGGVVYTKVTGGNGKFQFTNLAPGTYTISEILQSGYTNTSVLSKKVTVTSGQSLNVTTKYGLFGNVPTVTAHKYAYVVNDGSNNVTVFDTAINPAPIITSIPVGDQPWDAAMAPDGSRVYVTNQGIIPTVPGSVSVIDAATNTVTTTIPVGNGTTGIAITPDGTKAYVTNQADNTVSAIDTTTNTVIGLPIAVDFSPFDVAIAPDGTKAYVTDSFFNETDFTLVGNISIIDTATNTVVSHINLGTTLPEGIAIAPDGGKAYVANFGDAFAAEPEPSSVSVVDLTTNTVSATIPIGFFNNSKNVAITPDGTRAYVTIGTDGTVVQIDIATNLVTGSPIIVGSEPQGIVINPDP